MTARRTPIIWLICPAATEMREGSRPVERATKKKKKHIKASSSRSILNVITGGINSRFHNRTLSAAAKSMAQRERMKKPRPTTPAKYRKPGAK